MSALADVLTQTLTFRDDLTPDFGLAVRRWTPQGYRRMAYPVIFGPEERLNLADGEIIGCGHGLPRLFSRKDYYRLA